MKVVKEILEGRLAMVCLGEEVPMVWLVELVEDFEMAEL